ncbi:MAG: metal dependent phosphohydrolase [Patescibacteria group bacterium]|nr:metal dependent phosphohydrolase [Patescibacteria group bacterium]
MEHIDILEAKVKVLYEGIDPGRDQWATWYGDNHVFVVADYATELAKKHGANEELARAAALLHDIADVRMKRSTDGHEQESLRMARELMRESSFLEREIKLVVDDAIRYHSCHGDEHPESVEGKILSTADSLAHLKTDFYVFAIWAFGRDMKLEDIKQWALNKIERDLNNKIFFDDVREDVMPDYRMIKELFSR